jgi:hypothetical protein
MLCNNDLVVYKIILIKYVQFVAIMLAIRYNIQYLTTTKCLYVRYVHRYIRYIKQHQILIVTLI